jgi:hypothetical protein
MRWNKEKIVFALSCAVSAVVVVMVGQSWFAQRIGTIPELSEPRSAGDALVRGGVDLPWFKAAGSDVKLRNPYLVQTGWRPAPLDALARPPLTPLVRRVPVPATLAGAAVARPLREWSKPAVKDEQGEQSP